MLVWFVFFFFMVVGFISICLIDDNYDAIYDYCKQREEKRFRKNKDKYIKELNKKLKKQMESLKNANYRHNIK